MSENDMCRFDMVGIGITQRCNLTCPHCYSSAVKKMEREFTTDECKRLIDSVARLTVKKIAWTGGEPLLRKDLEQLIVYARDKYGLTSGVTTNGVLITERMVKKLKETGISSFQISLDGSTAEKNYPLRRATQRQFDFVIRGIEISVAHGLPVCMAMVISRDTLDDVLDYLELARKLGVTYVRFCGFVPAGFANSTEIRDRMEFRDDLKRLKELVETLVGIESIKIALDPGFGPLPPDYSFHKCQAGQDTFYIGPNGNVYPCTGLLNDRFKIGNVHEKPLEEIVNDPHFTDVSRFDPKQLSGPCRNCPYLMVCHGACRGATFAHTGDLNASFPACLYQAD